MISKKNFILSICFALIYICSQLPLKAADSDQNVLWAWQRNEDLSYLNPASYSVAYLACYATISGANLHLEWRNQALKIPAGTNLVPVLRIDINHRSKPELTEEKLGGLSDVILRISKISRTQRVQIDFDALENEREFYRNLLKKTREKLTPEISISITSLASWCLFDNWLTDLPVQETVPMMFSLGKERAKVLRYFKTGHEFLCKGCCKSLGVSLEDLEATQLMIGKAKQRKIPTRIYFFTRTPWTKKKLETVQRMLETSEK
jgi:hypothetical protein